MYATCQSSPLTPVIIAAHVTGPAVVVAGHVADALVAVTLAQSQRINLCHSGHVAGPVATVTSSSFGASALTPWLRYLAAAARYKLVAYTSISLLV